MKSNFTPQESKARQRVRAAAQSEPGAARRAGRGRGHPGRVWRRAWADPGCRVVAGRAVAGERIPLRVRQDVQRAGRAARHGAESDAHGPRRHRRRDQHRLRIGVCGRPVRHRPGTADRAHRQPGRPARRSPGTRAREIAARTLESAAEQDLLPVGVRLALPGLVSDGTVRQAPNLGWNRVPAEELFARALAGLRPAEPALPVSSENEANLAALAELWFGGLGPIRSIPLPDRRDRGRRRAGARTVNCCAAPTGSPARSAMWSSTPTGPLCRCGSRGCLEQYAGQSALLRGRRDRRELRGVRRRGAGARGRSAGDAQAPGRHRTGRRGCWGGWCRAR